MDSGIDTLLLSFNLTRPQRMTERNNPTYPPSRSPAENTLCSTRCRLTMRCVLRFLSSWCGRTGPGADRCARMCVRRSSLAGLEASLRQHAPYDIRRRTTAPNRMLAWARQDLAPTLKLYAMIPDSY